MVLVEKSPTLGGRTTLLYRYSQLMTLAYGGPAKDTGLDGQVIRARKLEEIAVKVVKK